ncbi:PhzF family phenazine biosynthesis protein [Ottowia testudinis]|uniref:PhzF family phenazine biosynthesis protein n=1 Tax=Ottowia testudinis TaxID=2816950 RepID=A0A975H355_9BURK|nr:PhzF family phenazine biosynthesis protein [Ottowia testudinis]QTD44910.1 PhzF family phenazine biosynthesis protein [Ottowia testudinis]
MNARPFQQIDVFTAAPGFGNPVAVVLDGTGLDGDAMQRFARWTNLSETTFVLPPTEPQADYRLRIFTPGGELPFAGHPTLGSCFAWLAAGGQPKSAERIVQQCAKGLIPIRRDGARLAFAAPPSVRSDLAPDVLAQTVQALGLKPEQVRRAQLLDNGPVWLTLQLDSADTVLALAPNHAQLVKLGFKVGVAGVHQAPAAIELISKSSREARAFGASADAPLIEVRAFAAPIGVTEDPVTGSLNASLAQWLIDAGELPTRYVAAQGMALGRAGRVHIERDAAGQVWVGGDCVRVIQGRVTL